MVEHDLPVTTLSKLLGHECLSTTQVYVMGADPQVRQDYALAMANWDEPGRSASPDEDPGPTRPFPPVPAPPAHPVPRKPLLQPDLAKTWAPTLPDWVREACLAYVRQEARNRLRPLGAGSQASNAGTLAAAWMSWRSSGGGSWRGGPSRLGPS